MFALLNLGGARIRGGRFWYNHTFQ